MSRLQDLKARLMLDNSQFGRGLRDSRTQAQGFASAVRSIMAPVAVAVTGALSFGGVAASARKGASEIDEVAKSARALSGSVGGVRALELAMSEAGVNVGVLREQFQNMDRQIASGRAETALRALGLQADDLARMDVDQKIATVSDRIKDLGLDTGSTLALLQQFGVENRNVSLLMMQGGDAIRAARQDVDSYGLALSSIDTAKIEAANDQIGRLSIVGQYLRQELALRVVPALGDLAQKMTDGMREGGGLRRVIDALVGTVTGFRNILNLAGVAVATYTAARVPAFLAALAAKSGAVLALRGSLSLMTAQMYAGATASAVMTGAVRTLGTMVALAGGPLAILVGLVGGATAAMILFRDTTSTAPPILDEAKRAIDEINQVLNTSSSTALPEAQRATLALTNENIRLAKSAYEAAEAEMAKARANAYAAQQQLGAESMSSLPFESLPGNEANNRAIANLEAASERLRKAQIGLQDRINEGQLKLAQTTGEIANNLGTVRTALQGVFGDVGGVAAMRDALTGVPPELGKIDAGAQRVESSFESAFVNGITNIKNARQALSGLLMDLAKMAAQSAFRGLFGGSKIFGGIASLFGIGANANGTENWRGGLSWVGERGPELVNLPKGSQVFDAQKSINMMRGARNSEPVQIVLSVQPSGEFDARVTNTARAVVRVEAPQMIGAAFGRAREQGAF
jgi:hypothetical protein